MNAVQSTHQEWVAIAFGALDVAQHSGFNDNASILVTPTIPSLPLALNSSGADLWKRLVHGPVASANLKPGELDIVLEMADMGIASNDPDHLWRVKSIPKPWLVSPMHELVYGLAQSVARGANIDCVFIKGPVMRMQGLREREHSGDVDIWVKPSRVRDFLHAMSQWGWNQEPEVWGDIPFNHSETLTPTSGWGCQIDVHRRMPGLALKDDDAFTALLGNTEFVDFAGISVLTPSRVMHAVLGALHLIRPEIGDQNSSRGIEAAAELLAQVGVEAIPAARATDALKALQKPLETAFSDLTIDMAGAGQPRDWLWRGRPNKFSAYLGMLAELPWRERPALALRLFWPSREAVKASDERLQRPSRTTLSARLRRLKRGLTELRSSRSQKQP